jgi:hypothetical protein
MPAGGVAFRRNADVGTAIAGLAPDVYNPIREDTNFPFDAREEMICRLELRRAFRFLGLVVFPIVVALLASGQAAQQPTAPRLADYVGTYADAPGHTLELVDGDGLFAVVDEAKYPLRPAGVDKFMTMTGQTVPFLRDASGKVTGYEQNGKFHPRISTAITAESAALAHPRPEGRTRRRTIATIFLPTRMTGSR